MKPGKPFAPIFGILCAILLLQGCASLSPSTRLQPAPNQYIPAPGAEPVMLETGDAVSIFGQWWLPQDGKAPDAVILLLHGTIAHSGFYGPMAEYFSDHDYAVLGFDLRGWGQSQKYARNGVVNDYDEYLIDLKAAYDHARDRFPDVPLFIQGESMGGAIALLSQSEEDLETAGLVLNAPAIRPGLSFGFVHFPHWLNNFGLWAISQPGKALPNMPAFYHGRLMEKMGIGLLLKEEENQERFINDPFSTHKALPLSYFTALQDATTRVEKGLGQVTAPLIILHGTDDVLVPLKSSKFAMEELASEDKTLKVYEELTHATLHDRRRKEVWDDIVSWLDDQLIASGVAAPPHQRGAATEAQASTSN